MTLSWDIFLCTIAVNYELTPAQYKIFRFRFNEVYRNLREEDFCKILDESDQSLTSRQNYKKQLTEIYKKLEKGCKELNSEKKGKSIIIVKWLDREYSQAIALSKKTDSSDDDSLIDKIRKLLQKNNKSDNEQIQIDWETICSKMLNVNSKSNPIFLDSKDIYISPILSKIIKAQSQDYDLLIGEEVYESVVTGELNKCLLIGDKGIGKSTFLYHFGKWILQQRKGYPIYLSLEENQNKSLTYYLIEHWLKEVNASFLHLDLDLSSQHLLHLFKQGKVWLLIDGITHRKDLNKLLVDTLQVEWIDKANILLSCHPKSLPDRNLETSQFNIYYLTLFNEQQIETFIKEWFIDKEEWGYKLLENLNQPQYSSLQELIKHPQNLTNLCSSWENKQIKPSKIPNNVSIIKNLPYSFIYWRLRFLLSEN